MSDTGNNCNCLSASAATPAAATCRLLAPIIRKRRTADYDVLPFTPSQLVTVTYVVPVVVPEDTVGTGDGDIGIEDIGTTVVGTAPMYTVGIGIKLSARYA